MPWSVVLVVLVGAGAIGVNLGYLRRDMLGPALRPLAEALGEALGRAHIGGPELVAAAVGALLLFGRRSWPWPLWPMIVVGSWAFATYAVGQVTLPPVEEWVTRLASQPGVDVFEPPPGGRLDALFVLAFAALLIPVVAAVGLFLLWAWSAFLRDLLFRARDRWAPPNWALMVPMASVVSGLAWAENAVWLPWCLWVLGVIARAYTILQGS